MNGPRPAYAGDLRLAHSRGDWSPRRAWAIAVAKGFAT